MSRPRNKAYLLLLLLIPIGFIIFLKKGTFTVTTKLPIYGERYLPQGSKDTVYHTVGEYSFTDQHNNVFNEDSVKGKIRIVNFFFARCKGVCPKMNGNLALVFNKYQNSPGIIFVSHTVDPENDSAEVLNEYARQMDVKYGRWYFVTGKYADIAYIQNQYLLPKADSKSIDEIAHSQQVILVDREDRVRGAYDGLSINEMNKLIEDIKILLAEYNQKK